MYPKLTKTIAALGQSDITSERKAKLQVLIDYIQAKKDQNEAIKLNFICTHNSRRSHLGQVWAKTLAAYYGIDNLKSYSGGTEETAVFPLIIETLKNQGFEIYQLGEGTNPTYKLSFDSDTCPMTLFSKQFDDHYNPREDFAAIMTCNDADQNCPIIPRALRISLSYRDPKVADGTAQQIAVYAERSEQIANEMNYVFSSIR